MRCLRSWGRGAEGNVDLIDAESHSSAEKHRNWEREESEFPALLCPAIDLGQFINSLIRSSNKYQPPTRCIDRSGIETRKSGLEFRLNHLPAVCLRASCFPSLCFSFLISKLGIHPSGLWGASLNKVACTGKGLL